MSDQLPILQILLPFLSAPLCVLARRGRLALGFGIAVCWATFGVSIALLQRVLQEGVVRYELGGWAAPWGIEYRVDPLGAFVLLFVSGIAALVLSYAPLSIRREIPQYRRYLFITAYLLCLTGLLGIAITGDLFNLFVFIEISALSSYSLIALGRDRRSLTAAFQYLILGTIGATFIVIAIGLLFMMTGTLNMADMALRLTEVTGTRTLRVAFAFFTVGVAIKAALFPLHLWLPNAYTYAPSVVSAFLAATATKVSIYIFLRFVFSVFGPEIASDMRVDRLVLPLAIAGIFIASIAAIFQDDVKRLLAYSSVAQIGYMGLGFGLANTDGLTGGIVHMFNHALTKGALFMATGAIVYRIGNSRVDSLRGLGRRMPWTMAAWVLGGLGLIGVPLTAGFISKWYLVLGAFERGWWWLAALVLIGSLLALVYVWRIVETAYFSAPEGGADSVSDAPLSLILPTWILVGASLFFGVFTEYSAGIARQAAEMLLGSGP
jgi:multicomponent Na+:H+ antiporter subunit D